MRHAAETGRQFAAPRRYYLPYGAMLPCLRAVFMRKKRRAPLRYFSLCRQDAFTSDSPAPSRHFTPILIFLHFLARHSPTRHWRHNNETGIISCITVVVVFRCRLMLRRRRFTLAPRLRVFFLLFLIIAETCHAPDASGCAMRARYVLYAELRC